jgi:hypothetical protein
MKAIATCLACYHNVYTPNCDACYSHARQTGQMYHYGVAVQIANADKEISAKVDELKAELPGITYGYIGNIEIGPYRDDRSFRIFLPHPGRVGTYRDSVALGSIDDLPIALAKWASILTTVRLRYASEPRQ